MTPEVYWLAGLIEGEGSFSLSRGKYLRFSLSMTDYDVVARAADVAGVGNVNGPYQRGHHKAYWIWQTNKRADVVHIIGLVYGNLGIRRRAQIDECLRAQGGN